MTARWWIILRADYPSVPFHKMIGYRLSVFGLSYFTPGPQVGGEPLQVIYLQQDHNVNFLRAVSAVILDKLFEFLSNLIMMSMGLLAIFRLEIFLGIGFNASLSLAVLSVLLILPLVYFILIIWGSLPISKIFAHQKFISHNLRMFRLILASERMAASYRKKHPRHFLAALTFSLLTVTGIGLEYYLICDVLGIKLTMPQTFAALTFMQFAFLMPLPGGLGALEASQVFIFSVLGYPSYTAISLTLLMRGRDILNGMLGLILIAIRK